MPAHEMISPAQWDAFAGEVHAVGGATIHAITGEKPTSGYMVSLPGREVQRPAADFTGEAAQAHALVNLDELHQPDKFSGGWVEDGVAYSDVSENILNEQQAIHAGQSRAQLAIHENVGHADVHLQDSSGKSLVRQRPSGDLMGARRDPGGRSQGLAYFDTSHVPFRPEKKR